MQVFEGTWEEIKVHDAELAGQRVRVTILNEPNELKTFIPHQNLAAQLNAIALCFASLPDYDQRSPDEILGYDSCGLPQ